MAKAMVIRTSGLVEAVSFPETANARDKLDWYYKVLGCDIIDVARPYGLEKDAKATGLKHLVGKYCMIVDDEGLLKEDFEVNVIASLLYGYDDHGQPLAGDVLVCKNEMTDEGMDSVGMDDADLRMLFDAISRLVAKHNKKVSEQDGRY